MKIFSFAVSALLALIAYVLFLPVEIITIIIVGLEHKREGLDFFKDTGYDLDVISASRHRTTHNMLRVRKGGDRFTKGTDKSISYYIGTNYEQKTLTWLGLALYWLLYVIDFANWFKGGHCVATIRNFNSSKKQ